MQVGGEAGLGNGERCAVSVIQRTDEEQHEHDKEADVGHRSSGEWFSRMIINDTQDWASFYSEQQNS